MKSSKETLYIIIKCNNRYIRNRYVSNQNSRLLNQKWKVDLLCDRVFFTIERSLIKGNWKVEKLLEKYIYDVYIWITRDDGQIDKRRGCNRDRSDDRNRECKKKKKKKKNRGKINQRRLGDFYFVLYTHIVNN